MLPIERVQVRVQTLPHFRGELPSYQTPLAAGADVRAQIEKAVVLEPGQRCLIPTGLKVEVPEGYEIQVRPRSGWALRDGVTLVNSPGTIDSDYRGEIGIILINHGTQPVTINPQDRIAQLVLCPVARVEWVLSSTLSSSERGEGGFGSTGRGYENFPSARS